FLPILEGIARWRPPVRFHLPNAVHPRYIDRDTARLLRAAGFVTIRLGFEGMGEAARARSSGKVDRGAAEAAVAALVEAGFTARELGAYLLFGLPGLDPRSWSRISGTSTGWGSRSSWPASRPSRA